MGYNTQDEIVKIVNRLIKRCGTRNPYKVADELGIHILYRDFTKQRGAYKVILKNRFIFLRTVCTRLLNKSYYGTKSDTMFFIAKKQFQPEDSKNLISLICVKTGWNTKPMSLRLRLLYRTIRLLNILNRGMIFSKLLAVCTPT